MSKIAVIGGYAPSLINFRGDLLREMVAAGHEVLACAPDASDKTINELDRLGVEYFNIPISRTGLNPFSDALTFFSLLQLFKKEQVEVVLSYTAKPVIYGSLAANAASIPLVYSMVTGLGNGFSAVDVKGKMIGVIVSFLYRIGLTNNLKIFFQNPDDLLEFQSRKLVRDTDRSVLINGSGINTQKFNVRKVPAKIRFVLIARLLKDKGICEYADAAAIIKKKHPTIEFDLVGWLDQNPACISPELLRKWVVAGIINHLGKLDDVRPAISNSSVYVLPSYYGEGTPRTILEAMSMGRAIITTDSPGCRETVVDGENGFLVPIKNVEKLVEAMEKFILHPELIPKMGKRSRAIAEEKYDVNKVNKVILETMGLA